MVLEQVHDADGDDDDDDGGVGGFQVGEKG